MAETIDPPSTETPPRDARPFYDRNTPRYRYVPKVITPDDLAQ